MGRSEGRIGLVKRFPTRQEHTLSSADSGLQPPLPTCFLAAAPPKAANFREPGPPSGPARRDGARQPEPARLREKPHRSPCRARLALEKLSQSYDFRLFGWLSFLMAPVRFLTTRIHWPNQSDFHRLTAHPLVRSPNRLLQLCWSQQIGHGIAVRSR